MTYFIEDHKCSNVIVTTKIVDGQKVEVRYCPHCACYQNDGDCRAGHSFTNDFCTHCGQYRGKTWTASSLNQISVLPGRDGTPRGAVA